MKLDLATIERLNSLENFKIDMSTSRRKPEFEFSYNSKHTEYALEINTLLSQGKPFMIKHKYSATVFVPKELVSFFSGDDSGVPLNQRHVQHYDSIESMNASIGMLLYSCKGVISAGNQLENDLKLIPCKK